MRVRCLAVVLQCPVSSCQQGQHKCLPARRGSMWDQPAPAAAICESPARRTLVERSGQWKQWVFLLKALSSPVFQEQQLHCPPTLGTEEFVLLEHSCTNWIKVSESVDVKTHFWHDFYYTLKVSCLLWQMTFGKSHHLFFVRCFSLYCWIITNGSSWNSYCRFH